MDEQNWFQFLDMHSGGGTKEPPYEKIYIQAASEEEAMLVFYNAFGHNPDRVTCTCCGSDYSISGPDSLDQITAYQRGCAYNDAQRRWVEHRDAKFGRDYLTLQEYEKRGDVLFLPERAIKPEWRTGKLPEQGYVWID